ncbi:3-keto-disaccharide hydrolase [Tundrisphaera sp. TA3]|uniref:3-keto-disaccharide hydrolase n=1 Tax=Tundrisphaera sp. TA3 TaxID=3435775 RepID=UPI003EB9ED52
MIRSWKAAACLALGLATAPATAPAQDAKAPAGEWVSLFDGKTLSGWTAVPLNKQPSKWEVKDGVIEGTGSQSMLYSPRGDYKNFVFRAEIKINDKGNSGMYVRCPAMKPSFTDGYEIQVNSTHTDPVRTGSLYTLVNLFDSSNPPPPDTYFTQQIEVEDVNYRGKVVTRFRISVNDKLLYEYLDHDKLFAAGHFAFQQHDPGSRVSIRKVEVKELPAK